MKSALIFASIILFLSQLSLARAEGMYTVSAGCDASRVNQSPEMMRSLRALSAINGSPVRLISCYRSQATQNNILKRHNCQPYGPYNCSGRVGSTSQHTYGTAADIQLNTSATGVCKMLDKVRSQVRGGMGGIGGYGGNHGHLDMRNSRCQWNICKRVLGPCSAGGYHSEAVNAYRASNPKYFPKENTGAAAAFYRWFYNSNSDGR